MHDLQPYWPGIAGALLQNRFPCPYSVIAHSHLLLKDVWNALLGPVKEHQQSNGRSSSSESRFFMGSSCDFMTLCISHCGQLKAAVLELFG